MSMLVWVMMAIAVWHFTVFVPDRFWGGIVGAFLAAILGAAVFGLAVSGLSVPGSAETTVVQALIAIPGSLMGLAASYVWGARHGREHGGRHGGFILDDAASAFSVRRQREFRCRHRGNSTVQMRRRPSPTAGEPSSWFEDVPGGSFSSPSHRSRQSAITKFGAF